jgi:hypothetical protein
MATKTETKTGGATNTATETAQPDLMAMAGASGKADVEQANVMGENFPIYSPTKDIKIGGAVEGTYCGTETRGQDDDGNDRVVHVFTNAKGDKFGLWGRGGLNLLHRVPMGTLTVVKYAAYEPKNKRPMPQHVFDVSIAKGVNLLPPTAKAAVAN